MVCLRWNARISGTGLTKLDVHEIPPGYISPEILGNRTAPLTPFLARETISSVF